MRKILLIICAILTTTSTYATQMCARRNTTVIPLDGIPGGKNVNGKTYWADQLEWVWYAQFEYGCIYGAATCLSVQEVRDIQGDQSLTNYVDSLVTDEDTIQGRSDYYNGDTTNPEYERKFCYCKLMHPMSSRWVFRSSTYAASCSSDCALSCAYPAFGNTVWRTGMFNTIGYGYADINDAEYTESIDL